MAIRVFIVDDHPIFRAGLIKVIGEESGLRVAGQAADGLSALEEMRAAPPDVALLDIDIPKLNGLDLAEKLQQVDPPVPAIMLTMHRDRKLFDAAMACGARGYILKENAVNDVIAGVCRVARGEIYLTASISHYLLERRQRAEKLHEANPCLSDLTKMEREVLARVSRNRTSKEIAAGLSISPRTVEAHRNHICRKLGLRGSNALLQFALEHRFDL
jgi:DNA-binding NarL/FixJ family response regulator